MRMLSPLLVASAIALLSFSSSQPRNVSPDSYLQKLATIDRFAETYID